MEKGLHAVSSIPTYVVIPTRNRHDMLKNCIHSISPVGDEHKDNVQDIIVVDNLSDPPIPQTLVGPNIHITPCYEDPPNISKLWNIGIDMARSWANHRMQPEFNIAILNSDVICPEGWIAGMSDGLRKYNATLAYPDQHGNPSAPIKHVVAGPISLYERITGFAFMLRGETSIRLNEDLAWWYGDDDLDWRCRELGGAVLLPGLVVEHLDPNGSTNRRPELMEQAGRDRETFQKIWGTTPW